jgi:CheY-like chemotaxis protein
MRTSKPDLPHRSGEERGPPFRILCVDDRRDAADAEVLLLRAGGFEALACYDGPSALLAAEAFRPNVCLLDLNMPGMDGDEVAIRLLGRPGWHPLVLIAVTAMGDEASRARTEAAGFHLHLVKPVDPRKLLRMVADFRNGGPPEPALPTPAKANGLLEREEVCR